MQGNKKHLFVAVGELDLNKLKSRLNFCLSRVLVIGLRQRILADTNFLFCRIVGHGIKLLTSPSVRRQNKTRTAKAAFPPMAMARGDRAAGARGGLVFENKISGRIRLTRRDIVRAGAAGKNVRGLRRFRELPVVSRGGIFGVGRFASRTRGTAARCE